MLLGLMLIAAVAEVVSLGTVLPFLSVLAAPEEALQKPFIQSLIKASGLTSEEDLRWLTTALFASVAFLSGTIRILLVYAIMRTNASIAHEIGSEVYRRALYQPYTTHISRNSSLI